MSIILKIHAKKGKPPRSGHEFMWSVIMDREMGGLTFDVDDIFTLSNLPDRNTINLFIKRIASAGIIERTGNSNGRGAPIYRVVRRQSATPVITSTGAVLTEHVPVHQALWNAMRSPTCNRGFALADLVFYASTDTAKIKASTARNYIHYLMQAGYLTVLQRGTAKVLAMWRLTRNTGPLAPKILRSDCVYDPNAEKIFGEPVVREAGQ